MGIRYGADFAPRGMRSATNFIIVHCSAGHEEAKAADVTHYHMVTLGWLSCGYHTVIERDGTIVETLHPNAIGAHIGDVKAVGNRQAFGVCLIGGIDAHGVPTDNFTEAQMSSLARVLKRQTELHPTATVLGHRDAIQRYGGKGAKACPCFDAPAWWADWKRNTRSTQSNLTTPLPRRKPISLRDQEEPNWQPADTPDEPRRPLLVRLIHAVISAIASLCGRKNR